MANNALTRLYRIMVQDPNGDQVVQRRILAVGSAANDGDLLATLENLPDLAPDVDAAIGKRKGAKERAAWIARKERTPEEVRAAIKSEKRVVVLQAAAKRTDLEQSDYRLLAKHEMVKVSSALLLNSAVDIETKKLAAVSWGRQLDGDNYRTHDVLVRHFGPHPATHDALASQSTCASVLTFVAKSNLSEASQLRVVEHVVEESLLRLKFAKHGYDVLRRIEEASEAAFGLAVNPGTTDAVRARLLKAFEGIGVIPAPTDNYYRSATSPEAERQKAIEAIKAGPKGAVVDPAEEAVGTTDVGRLLELANLAKADSNQRLAQAVMTNPLITPEIVRTVDHLIGWSARQPLLETLVVRDDPAVFVELVVQAWGMVDDNLLGKAPNPSDVLRAIAARMTDPEGYRTQHFVLAILQSRWCTPEVLKELPISVIGHPEAPAGVAAVVNAALVASFQEDDEKWTLFEALVGDGNLPLREVIEAVHALSA